MMRKMIACYINPQLQLNQIEAQSRERWELKA